MPTDQAPAADPAKSDSPATSDQTPSGQSVEPQPAPDKAAPAVLNFTMQSLDGKQVPLGKYQGQVVLIVNVASECGLTGQYEDLQSLHTTYAPKGLAVLGFPANEFGRQEPGTNAEIAQFCQANYGVTFDMFAKVVVKGAGCCPLYTHLTDKQTNPKFFGPITWNFEKFVIGRNGEIVARFAPNVSPGAPEVIAVIEAELAKKAE